MKQITISSSDFWDEKAEEFIPAKCQTLQLEHSLISISKWEQKWHKAFLGNQEKTPEEILSYIQCMTLTPHVDPDIYNYITREDIKDIFDYVNDPMTATTINRRAPKKQNNEILTSELIYYYMIQCGIPFECEKWHLNRLIMLIQVCGAKSEPPKKMSRNEIARRNHALNASRRNRLNSKG